MKLTHEEQAASMSDEVANRGVGLLINQSVTVTSQFGGITAHTINLNFAGPALEEPDSSVEPSPRFVMAEPKDGQARFRPPDQALGFRWNNIPYADTAEIEIYLATGPAMWLRLLPKVPPGENWSCDELRNSAMGHGTLTLQPFVWTNLNSLRAEDGFGTYSSIGPRDSETASVAFAFETGEVWSIDTFLLSASVAKKRIYFLNIARVFTQRLRDYGAFLQYLGTEPPYDWIGGLDGVKGYRLEVPPPPNHVNPFPGNACLAEVVSARGTYSPQQPTSVTLRPFFDQIFRKCSTKFPEYLDLEKGQYK
jgi:hypothetical protein